MKQTNAAIKKLARPDFQNRNIECPVCKGYGKITHVVAHTKSEILCSCAQCYGWGWVSPGLDAECVHEFTIVENVGRCLTQYTCHKCGRQQLIDSSD